MALYVSGLLLLTAAIELTLALFLASQGKVPGPSSSFYAIYLAVDLGLYAGAGLLMALGLSRLRSGTSASGGSPRPAEPPVD